MPIEALFTGHSPVLRFVYRDADNNRTEREATPLSVVVMKNGSLGMRAICKLRGALRTFALTRLESLLALDGQPHPDWEDLHAAFEGPAQRIQSALLFANAWPSKPSQHHWTDLAQTDTGLAWRAIDGIVRMDPKMAWYKPDAITSAHALLAQKAAMNRAATLLLQACPPQAQRAMVHQGRAGWQDISGRWHPLP